MCVALLGRPPLQRRAAMHLTHEAQVGLLLCVYSDSPSIDSHHGGSAASGLQQLL